MIFNDAINLIKNGVDSKASQTWADLGCGKGVFTEVLSYLLGKKGHVYAVDKERQQFSPHQDNATIEFI